MKSVSDGPMAVNGQRRTRVLTVTPAHPEPGPSLTELFRRFLHWFFTRPDRRQW